METQGQRRQFAIRELAMTGGEPQRRENGLEGQLTSLSPRVLEYVSLGHRIEDPQLPLVYRQQLKDQRLHSLETFNGLEKAQLYEYDKWMSEAVAKAGRRDRGTGTPNIRT